ncbi:hypothetical protein [Natrarchaeobaculum aegyptiacum]|nr:hypothetical protein [Natrarchaeobaculum aegyptiacum]
MHVIAELFGDRALTASIFFTASSARVEVDPPSTGRLETLAATHH